MGITRDLVEADRTIPAYLKRNKLINGKFNIWQRGINFIGAVTQQYHADRWRVLSPSGSVNISRQLNIWKNLIPNSEYYHRINIESSPSTTQIQQLIEGVDTLAGGEVTLSFWASSSSPSFINNIRLIQDFGDGSTYEISLATGLSVHSLKKYELTGILPDTNGKVLGVNNHLRLTFDFNPNNNTDLNLLEVQLEKGNKATPFEHLAYREELALCQRYYQKLEMPLYLESNGASNDYSYNTTTLLSEMRESPSVLFTEGLTLNLSQHTLTANQAQLRHTIRALSSGRFYGRLDNVRLDAEL